METVAEKKRAEFGLKEYAGKIYSKGEFLVKEDTLKHVHFSNEKLNIGIDKEKIRSVGAVYHTLFSNQFMLRFKVIGFKYNITGVNWYQFHNLLGEIQHKLDKLIDNVAKKHRELGLLLPVRFSDFYSMGFLKDEMCPGCNWNDIFSSLNKCNDELIRFLRNQIDFVGGELGLKDNESFLIGMLRSHEKIGWKLRAFLMDSGASVS